MSETPVKKRRGRPPKNAQRPKINIPQKKQKKVCNSIPLVINCNNERDEYNSANPVNPVNTFNYTELTMSFIVELQIGKDAIEKHKKLKKSCFEEDMFMHDIDAHNDINAHDLHNHEQTNNEIDKQLRVDNQIEKLKKHQIHIDDSEQTHTVDKYIRNQYDLLKNQLHVKNMSNTEIVPLKWKRVKIPKELIVYDGHSFNINIENPQKSNEHVTHTNTKNNEIIEHKTINYDGPYPNVKIQFMKTHKHNVVHNDDLMTVSHLPTNTDVVCWNDNSSFKGVPVVVPMKFEDSKYYVFGNFCSFGCALRYIYDRYRYSTIYEELQSLLFMYYLDTHGNSKIHDIVMAPELITLCSHGGIYTLKQYREYATNNVICSTHAPNVVAVNYQIEEIYTNERSNKKFIPVNLNEINESTLKMNERYNTERSCGIEMKQIELKIVSNTVDDILESSTTEIETGDIFSEHLSNDMLLSSVNDI